MNRMIACKKCAARPEPHYAGEWFKRVNGTARGDMFCDYCSIGRGENIAPTPIKKGDKCAAESMGVDGHGIPYFPWESELLIL